MTEREKDLEVLGALKSVAYDQAPPEWWTFMEEQLQEGQRLEDATDIYAEILIDVMAYALTPMPEVAKHGNHDQSSHNPHRGGKTSSESKEGPETEKQKAMRMGAEFEAKRSTGEPIDAITELEAMPRGEMRRFVTENRETLGLLPPYQMGRFTYDEADILVNAVERRKETRKRNEENFREREEGVRVAVQDSMTDYATSGKVMVAMPEGPALKILEGGERAKSQFETGRSGGAFTPSVRAEMETAMYRVHPGVDPGQRHTYGYVALKDPTSYATAQYGAVRFELSPDVHSRTGITAGDSLGSPAVPIPMGSRPSQRSAFDAAQGHSGHYFYRSEHHSTAEANRYVEAQIQGGWGAGDIAKVYVQRASAAGYVATAAAELGIPVEYY